jgi:hypothetical protein
MKTADPLGALPATLRSYSRYPWGLLLAWVACALLLFSLPLSPHTNQSSSHPLAHIPPEQTAVSGEQVILAASGAESLRVSKQSDRLSVADRESIQVVGKETTATSCIYTLQQSASAGSRAVSATGDTAAWNSLRLMDASGKTLYTLSGDAEGFKLKDDAGSLVSRVKFKEGSFNVYDADGQRTLKGKEKGGRYLVRTEAGAEVRSFYLNGPEPVELKLRMAAIFSLPLPLPYRTLIFTAQIDDCPVR